ncbi:MAG TPA: SDR family NAD(P)-dependent oxidoreductase [Candidatus Acidoferrum sp.]|nr:SDR family NAD(P)-dependent oxidoreductase [Candidatus Acidoferrum sp.]
MKRFEDKCAVITGASSGVGKSIALALSREGATVALIGRDEAKLQAVAKEAASKTQIFTAEFCDDRSLELLGRTLAQTFSSIDVLVHSAGMIKLAPFASALIEDLDTHYRCNVRAPYALTQKLLPALSKAEGSIVFINSTAIENPRAGISQYAATKHALKAVADNLRDEVNKDGIRVLTVLLGRTATPMQEQICRVEQRPYDPSRLIQPEEAASVVVNALASSRTLELTNLHLRPALAPV